MPSSSFHLDEASSLSANYDTLFFAMVALCGIVALGVTFTLIYFAVKYRRGSKASRAHPVSQKRGLEYAWSLIPLALFIAIFIWAARLYADLFVAPNNPLVITVVGKQWMWKLQHPTGQREIDELHVPRGRAVKLVLTSEDVIHSFFVPAFRIKRDVLPGRYTTIWFQPTEDGEFHLFCAEYCGTDHARMGGRIIVVEPAEYQQWLLGGNISPGIAAQGAARFREFGCSGCHGANSSVHAPKLQGLFGKPVHLSDGRTVIADERYIRDSILMPGRDIVAGYRNDMPAFAGQINQQQMLELITYIKSLKPNQEVAQ